MIAEVIQRATSEKKEAIRLAQCIEVERRARIKRLMANARECARLRKSMEKKMVIRGLKRGMPIAGTAQVQRVSDATLRRWLNE